MRLDDMSFTDYLVAEYDLKERQRKEQMEKAEFEKYAKEHNIFYCTKELQEPCDDAVDRAEAMTEIMMFAGNVKSDEEDVYIKVSDAVQLLRELPSVRPQEPTGHWINHILSIECSCCGNKLFADDENENCEDYDAIDDLGYKFCPNCGAKMVEPQERSE